MKSMYATFLLAVNVWTELKQQIYWLIQQNQIREFDMHMIKCTRNEFCFEYINTYKKKRAFCQNRTPYWKKNSLTSYCDKKFENWENSYSRALLWHITSELEIKITITGYSYLTSSLCVEYTVRRANRKKRSQQGFIHKSVTLTLPFNWTNSRLLKTHSIQSVFW